MAHDVHVALEEILVKHDNKTREQAADFFKTLRTKRRYQQDVW
jgi:sulfite reductase alpha subunit-like flavoprotein